MPLIIWLLIAVANGVVLKVIGFSSLMEACDKVFERAHEARAALGGVDKS